MRNYISCKAALILSALALAGALTAQAQVTTNTLSITTFDPEAPANGQYGYFYGNNGLGVQSVQREYYLPTDTEMTNAMWHYTFDLTDLVGTTGYGTGTGGILFVGNTTPDMFTKTNREDYIVSFDARVEGLAADQTSAQGEMQISFRYPDPAGGTETLKSLQVNTGFAPTGQWKTFTYNLSEGALADSTTERSFAANATNTTDLRFNVNFHEPHNRFGYDAENVLLIDNVKVQVVDKPPAPVVEKYGVPILAWNFDDTNLWFEYRYQWSQNNDLQPVPSAEANVNGATPNTLGKDGTSGWMLNLDTTELANNPPQWAGGGTGGGGPADYTLFNTNDLSSYRITFDAKVAGLVEGKTNTTTVLQLHIQAPDNTILPEDEDGGNDQIIRLDFQIAGISTDWETYSFAFNKANVGQGSKENFANYLTNITQMNTQWQIENLTSADWGYDAENSMFIDNVRVERLYPVESTGGNPGRITAAIQGTNLVLTWNATNVRLQSTTSLSSPNWQDVPGATSGYTTPLSGDRRFFRLVQNTGGQ